MRPSSGCLFLGPLIAVALVLAACSGGGADEQDTAGIYADLEPVPMSDEAVAAFALAIEDLPEPTGDTEAEMLRSLLGRPDVFILQFEVPEDGGPKQRFETWFYLDLGVSYDFMDKVQLGVFTIQEPEPLTLIPLRFDPLDFSAVTTVDDLRAMMLDPASLVSEQPSEEYLTTLPVWAGEQLMAIFDGDGTLFYMETIPLVPGE